MNIKNTIKILILIPYFSYAQHSDKYLGLMNNLKPIDSSKIKTHFKNGQPKYSGTTTYYEYNKKEYSFLTGKHIRYYKNGSRTESVYDSWGTVMDNKYFDKNGNLVSDTKTVILNTTANDLQEFDNSNKHITFIIKSKDYKYSSELNKWYLHLESEHTNGKKSGTWNYYYPNGELKKQIEK